MLGYMSGKGPDFSAPVYSNAETAGIWYGYYENMLPCKVTVYGCRDDGNDNMENKAWEKIGDFEESPKLAQSLRWSRNAAGGMYNYVRLANKAAMEECDPAYLSIDFVKKEILLCVKMISLMMSNYEYLLVQHRVMKGD